MIVFRELEYYTTSIMPRNSADLEMWKKRNTKTRSIMGLKLSAEHLDHLRDVRTSKRLCTSIFDVSHCHTLLKLLNHCRHFCSSKVSEDKKGATIHEQSKSPAI